MLKLGLVGVLLITLLVLVGGCVPDEGAGEEGSIVPMLIFLALIFGVFYFLMIRPQRKKQKEHQELVQELSKGEKVVTAGGIYGTIESLNEESIVLKIESGSSIRIARGSVIGRRDK